MRAFLMALMTLAAAQTAYGAEALDLDAMLARALEKNPELSAMREGASAYAAGARAEGALEDPTLKVEMMDLSLERPLEATPGHSMLTRYTLSQAFPFPGKRALKGRIAEKGAVAARASVRAKELEVAALVKAAYFEYAFLDEAIRTTEGIKELVAGAARAANARYSSGQATQHDVISLNLEGSAITGEIITLEARKELASAKLRALMDMEQTQELSIEPSMPSDRVDVDADGLMRSAVESAPEVEMLASELEAGELEVRLAGKGYYPDFMVGLAPVQRDGRFESYDLMFQVSIPLWRGKYDSLAGQASGHARAARANLDAGRNRKALEVRGAAIEVDAAARRLDLFDTTLTPQAELAFDSAMRNYQTGRVDLAALIEVERALKRTRLERLKAVYEYNVRLSELERSSGVSIRHGLKGQTMEVGSR